MLVVTVTVFLPLDKVHLSLLRRWNDSPDHTLTERNTNNSRSDDTIDPLVKLRLNSCHAIDKCDFSYHRYCQ
jgi:hypothetical protein